LKKQSRSNILNFAAFICFIFALALVVLLRLFQLDAVVIWYNKYKDTLASYEQWIQANGTSVFSVLMIIANFTIKGVIPWFPISCICVAAGVLFPWYYAILINVVGLIILFTIKFFWGRRFGGGNAEKILSRYDSAHKFIESSKLGSKMVLFFVRLFPCLPINSVSQIYGTTTISYWKYLLVSLAGFSYKLFSYTIIGHNVYDPMSASFILPFVFLFLLSGIVLLALSGVISLTVGKRQKY